MAPGGGRRETRPVQRAYLEGVEIDYVTCTGSGPHFQNPNDVRLRVREFASHARRGSRVGIGPAPVGGGGVRPRQFMSPRRLRSRDPGAGVARISRTPNLRRPSSQIVTRIVPFPQVRIAVIEESRPARSRSPAARAGPRELHGFRLPNTARRVRFLRPPRAASELCTRQISDPGPGPETQTGAWSIRVPRSSSARIPQAVHE